MGNIGPVQARYEVLPTAGQPAPVPPPERITSRLVRLVRRAGAIKA